METATWRPHAASRVLAAASIYTVEYHVERPRKNYVSARRRFAELITAIRGVRFDASEIQSDVIFFVVQQSGFTAAEIAGGDCKRESVLVCRTPTASGAVTRFDVDRAGVEEDASTLGAFVFRGLE